MSLWDSPIQQKAELREENVLTLDGVQSTLKRKLIIASLKIKKKKKQLPVSQCKSHLGGGAYGPGGRDLVPPRHGRS